MQTAALAVWLIPPALTLAFARRLQPGPVVLSLIWFGISQATGDRRLYFPFCIVYAVQLAFLLRRANARPMFTAAALIMGAFTLVRIAQSAMVTVLAVELIVAAIVLAVTQRYLRNFDTTAAGVAASLLAFAGLLVN